MVSTRKDSRMEDFEEEVTDKFARVDGKLDAILKLLEAHESRFNVIEAYLKELPKLFSRRGEQEHNTPVVPREEMEGEASKAKDKMAGEISKSEEGMIENGGEVVDKRFNSIEAYNTHRQMELHVFTGNDSGGGLIHVERYFLFNRISKDDMLGSMMICFEGTALGGLKYREQRKSFRSWSEWGEDSLRRFGSGLLRSSQEKLITIKQTGTVSQFRERFEALAAGAEGLPEWLMGVLRAGVNEVLQVEICLFDPKDLESVIGLAQCVEGKNQALRTTKAHFSLESSKTVYSNQTAGKKWEPRFSSISIGNPKSIWGNASVASTAGKVTAAETKEGMGASKGFKKLTLAEYLEKISKGLCFRCDGKFGPQHLCKSKQLRVLWLCDEEESADDQEVGEDDKLIEEDPIELSKLSVEGLNFPRSMTLVGRIEGRQVTVLIESGATNNFINQGLVTELTIPTDSKCFNVTLGDGIKVRGVGVCRGAKLELQGITIVQNFLPFNLGNVDVILGIEWLTTLGEVRMNWKTKQMHFQQQGQKVSLNGNPDLVKKEITLKGL